MQPTVRFAHDHLARRHQPQQQTGGTATATMTQQRQQWDARLASFQRGLDHVMHCDAGDACGSALCHATKRLMRSYATHDCTNPRGINTASTAECKVCKLWGYILAKHKATTTARRSGVSRSPLSPTLVATAAPPSSTPVLPPLSCGLAHARVAGAMGRIGGIGGIGGGIGGGIERIGGTVDRDARVTGRAPRRRVIVTPELVQAMAKRV